MDTIQTHAWKATQQLCGSLDLEKALTCFFLALREAMPLSSIILGRFDEEAKALFVIAHTSVRGTKRLFQPYSFTPEQFKLAKSTGFFDPGRASDALITNRHHPLASLYRHGASVAGHPGYPFYAHRPAYENRFYGGASFHFEDDTDVTDDMIALIRAVAPPLGIFINAWFQYWELQQLKDQIYRDNRALRRKLSGYGDVQIIGAHGGLKGIMEQLRQVAPLDVSVLIQGETGTGKELAAKALHSFSPRRDKPFEAVNCGAIPPSLIDSELFGHAKGAFTGASAEHKGRFERADGGTLFLDEVAELPLDVQARLLRVLQERTVERVGGSAPIAVDFRLVTATHRNLESMVECGEFRQDLYYRLRVVSLAMPPLRERVQDISLLLTYFLEQAANRFGVLAPAASDIPDAEWRRLLEYAWPGNVRELQNVAEEALALRGEGPLHFHLPHMDEALAAKHAPVSQEMPETSLPATQMNPVAPYDEMMHDYLQQALLQCGGKIRGPGGAAELLGLNCSTLRDKMKKHRVPYGRDKGGEG